MLTICYYRIFVDNTTISLETLWLLIHLKTRLLITLKRSGYFPYFDNLDNLEARISVKKMKKCKTYIKTPLINNNKKNISKY